MQGAGRTIPSALDQYSSTIDSWDGNFDQFSDPNRIPGPHDDFNVLDLVDISTEFTVNMTDISSSADVYTTGRTHSVVQPAVSISHQRAYANIF